MKKLILFLVALIGGIVQATFGAPFLQPGEDLKSPREILEATELFWEENSKRDSLQCVNDPEGYAQGMQMTHDLLTANLFASHMCAYAYRSKAALKLDQEHPAVKELLISDDQEGDKNALK